MSALSGNLGEVDVPGILELARQIPGNTTVHINATDEKYVIALVDGQVVHASSSTQTGVEAVYQAFTQETGSFEIEKGGTTPPEQTIDLPWNTLLLQGLQRLDEAGNQHTSSEDSEIKENMMAREKLEDVLQEMASEIEPGLRGIGVAGSDGMGLAFHKVSGDNAENLSAQMALVIQVSRRSAQRLENSKVEDVLITSDDSYLLARFLKDNEHFVFVNVNRDSVLGNVRLVMRNYADRVLSAVPK